MLAGLILASAACIALLAMGAVVRTVLAAHPVSAPEGPNAPLCGSTPIAWHNLIRRLLRPERGLVALAIGLMLADTVLALAAPWPLLMVVDHGLSHHPYPPWLAGLHAVSAIQLAVWAAAAGLVLLAGSSTAGYLATFLMGTVNERMAAVLRTGLISHVLQISPQRIAAYPLGDLTSRIDDDAVRIADTVAEVTETIIPDLTILAGMIAITALIDWRLTLVVLGVIPLYAATARKRNSSVRVAQRTARARDRDLATLTADLLARIPAVQLFDRMHTETSSYAAVSGRAASASVAALDASARFSPVTDSLPGLGLAGALILGTAEVVSGRLTIGGLLVFLAYLSSLTAPVRSLARLSTTVARGRASMDRVTELLALPTIEPLEPPAPRSARQPAATTSNAADAPSAGPVVCMTDVSYTNGRGQQVLCGASFRAESGRLLCITGPSGSGKSTLLSLLVRLADPLSGRITIGGKDIQGLSLRALRQLVTLVPQDPWLRTGTILANIADGRPGASRLQIVAAAVTAGVGSFADGFASGLDTQVGEHGRQLSGGQRRQVAVARALLRDTPVLLLDEPTVGLDPAAESSLITSLLAAADGKTIIMVTHHPRLAALADRVVTLRQGRIESPELIRQP